MLEDGCAMVKGPGALVSPAEGLADALRLWDGICCYFEGKTKPASWIDQIMRAAKACSAEARQAAADAAEVRTREHIPCPPFQAAAVGMCRCQAGVLS